MSDIIAQLNEFLAGRYRLERLIGEGASATVYVAEDLRHGRKVALKVLRPELAAAIGADRFLAEIRTTANLQHPHILPLHDSGQAGAHLFFVMPYVSGETLRRRLERDGQLPVDEAVRIAVSVASALEHAHREGITHRDIKPANILLQGGQPVLADFGIAVAVDASGGRLTETGMRVGTPHYMSPEQAMGDRATGPRTDTYALGCVLYEMLVGEPPYAGGNAQAVLGRSVTGEVPSVTSHRRSTPPNVDAAVRKALQKVAADRFATAGEFARALQEPAFRFGAATQAGGIGAHRAGRRSAALAAVGAAVLLAAALLWGLRGGEDAPVSVARLVIPFADGQLPNDLLSFTRHGSLVYTNGAGAWIRSWATTEARAIAGTRGVRSLAISPDGREIVVADVAGPLRIVPIEGGPVRTLAHPAAGVWEWAASGDIYFTNLAGLTLSRIPADGTGPAETLTELRDGEVGHLAMRTVAGGRWAVFQVIHGTSGDQAEVWVVDLETGDRRLLVPGSSPRYAAGHLVYATTDRQLLAAPMNARTGELTGPPVRIAEDLASLPFGQFAFAYSMRDELVYAISPDEDRAEWEGIWVARSGQTEPLDPDFRFMVPSRYFGWTISPDGGRIVLGRNLDGQVDLWVKSLPRGPAVRLTSDDREENAPAWTPDGQAVTYVRTESPRTSAVLTRRADGGEPEVVLDSVDGLLSQTRWSPDGEWLLFTRTRLDAQTPRVDIVGLRRVAGASLEPVVASPRFAEVGPAFSPDGRWLAYSSNETGNNEVYVRPFPDVESRRVRVSPAGGANPRWSRDGGELFFIARGRHMIAARVTTDPDFRVLAQDTLFELGIDPGVVPVVPGSRGFDAYDIAPDRRFLMPSPRNVVGPPVRSYMILQGFSDALRRASDRDGGLP